MKVAAAASIVVLSGGITTAQDSTDAGEGAEYELSHTVSIPTIDAVDSTISESVLKEIFSGEVAGNAEALSTLDASSITVPEIEILVHATSDEEDFETIVTLTDLVMNNVADGVAESISLATIHLSSDDIMMSYGPTSISNFDIGAVLGVFGLAASDGSEEMKTLYTDLVAEGGTLEADDISCTFGNTTSEYVRARPLRTSFADIAAAANALEEGPDDIETFGPFMRFNADMLTAFESGEMHFEGLDCQGVDEDGQEIAFSIDGINVGEKVGMTAPPYSVDGLNVSVENQVNISIDNFTVKSADMSEMVAALANAPDTADEAWFEENSRAMLPAMKGFSLTGLDVDVLGLDEGPVTFSVGEIDLTLGDYINGLPSLVDSRGADIHFPLPESIDDEQIQLLRSLGITEFNGGFRFAAAWDEASEKINVEEISVTGTDLASIVLSGTLANAGISLFDRDMDVAEAAAMEMALKLVDLTLEDHGLSDLLLKIVAVDSSSQPAEMRARFADLAEDTVVETLVGVANAADMGKAVNTFISGAARTLNIVMEARNDPGLSAEDMTIAEDDPASLLDKVNLSVTAK